MLKEQRFDIILKELEKNTTGTYEVFATLLAVSEDTIRRDIDTLYRNGLLTKVRGGAMLRSKDPLSFHERTSFATDAKNIIGLKAQQFIKSGMTLFMDGGTTIYSIARQLPIDIELSIITNNPALIPVLERHTQIEVILLGGLYHKESATTVGADTCLEIGKYVADLYFMGSCAVDHDFGISATFKTDAEVKRAMLRSSKKLVALADQNKFRRTEPFKIASIEQIDVLITELSSDDTELAAFRNLGLQII